MFSTVFRKKSILQNIFIDVIPTKTGSRYSFSGESRQSHRYSVSMEVENPDLEYLANPASSVADLLHRHANDKLHISDNKDVTGSFACQSV